MGRPRINPLMRYDFEIDMWRTAEIKGSVAYTCTTPKQAIHLNHRLNMARATIRDLSSDGFVNWDLYVARNSGNVVTISAKQELDRSKITDGDGNPLTADDWNTLTEMTLGVPTAPPKAPAKTPSLKPPPPAYDPNKPLDLDIADE